LDAQGADLQKPVVIVQGITLFQDSLVNTSLLAGALAGAAPPLTYPDYAGGTNLEDHVSVLVRPSALCLDPRAPDQGGVLVTTGAVAADGAVHGSYPPADTKDPSPGVVIDSSALSNPQLSKLVNRKAAGTTNGLVGGCLPTGRYQINLVYPTGQAWTTPNETGSCAPAEGSALFAASGFDPGSCSAKPRPVLYSQGTRAVVEITPSTSGNCAAGAAVAPVPFACTSLCPDARLDPTASTPCSVCLDPTLDPASSPPCTRPLAATP
jgi:hypothetical protein